MFNNIPIFFDKSAIFFAKLHVFEDLFLKNKDIFLQLSITLPVAISKVNHNFNLQNLAFGAHVEPENQVKVTSNIKYFWPIKKNFTDRIKTFTYG